MGVKITIGKNNKALKIQIEFNPSQDKKAKPKFNGYNDKIILKDPNPFGQIESQMLGKAKKFIHDPEGFRK